MAHWNNKTTVAIATDDNLPARRAVQRVAQQRRKLADAGRYNQKIMLTAWEHDTFQLRATDAMDQHCGATGWEDLYRTAVADADAAAANANADTTSTITTQHIVADTLLLSCLLTSGSADGWIARTVTPVASLTRGVQGVAAVRLGTAQIHSGLLWLPVLTREQRQQSGSTRVIRPSTRLPVEMPNYLVTQQPTDIDDTDAVVDDFVRKWEEFLYHIISKEHAVDATKWVLWNAACSESERHTLAPTQKLVATTCQGDPHNPNSEVCCSFYDPNLEPTIQTAQEQW